MYQTTICWSIYVPDRDLLVHICTGPRSAGPYMYQTTICWSISVPVHVSAGPYLYRYTFLLVHILPVHVSADPYLYQSTFLLVHICTGTRFCWSISVPVHVSAGPYLNRSTICWSIFVPVHVSAGLYLYRPKICWSIFVPDHVSAWSCLYRSTSQLVIISDLVRSLQDCAKDIRLWTEGNKIKLNNDNSKAIRLSSLSSVNTTCQHPKAISLSKYRN